MKKHVIDTIFVICLLLLFMLSALTVIAIGASIYKKNVAQASANNSERISFAYVTEKVRQADQNGLVTVESFFGRNALVLKEEINGVLYKTYIYSYDGYLMELFARDDLNNYYPQTGQKIIRVNSFDISITSDNLLKVSIETDDGEEEAVYIAVRSGGR